jgi:hypothetical protein
MGKKGAHCMLPGRWVLSLTPAVLLLLLATRCSPRVDCPTPAPGAVPLQIPDCIVEKSNKLVISRLGKAFFQEHVVFQPALSSYSEGDSHCIQNPSSCVAFVAKPHYRMAYTITVPDLPGRELPAGIVVDAAGNLAPGAEIDGLPDCVHDPGECAFKVVDEASAIAIARQSGLEPGVKEWRTHFHWYGGELKTYVWTVENMLTVDESTGQSSGRTMLIDANSGLVLQVFDLQVIP